MDLRDNVTRLLVFNVGEDVIFDICCHPNVLEILYSFVFILRFGILGLN